MGPIVDAIVGKPKSPPKPAPAPAPVRKEDTTAAGEEARGEVKKRRGRRSTILNIDGSTSTPTRKSLLGSG